LLGTRGKPNKKVIDVYLEIFRPLQESLQKKSTNCIENRDFENAITKGHNNLDIGEKTSKEKKCIWMDNYE
jgi:hypothetical protein